MTVPMHEMRFVSPLMTHVYFFQGPRGEVGFPGMIGHRGPSGLPVCIKRDSSFL